MGELSLCLGGCYDSFIKCGLMVKIFGVFVGVGGFFV